MKRISLMLVTILCFGMFSMPAGAVNTETDVAELPQVLVTVGDHSYFLTLYDTPPSRELLDSLPLTLSFSDYAGTEKIAYLPENLTINDVQEPYEAQKGDLTVYTPWGNLAFFYHDFNYSASLYRLGHMEDIDAFAQSGDSFTATFEIQE